MKMSSHKATPMAPILFLGSLLLLSAGAGAINITRLLGQYPDFSTFNSLLTETGLSTDINRRQTITVLAIDNGAISSISSQPTDVVKKVLSLHVVLDYFDELKLRKLPNKTSTLTTLFQSSGTATSQLGFLNVTHLNSGDIAIGSSVKGTNLDAKLVKSVVAKPYNISVLQVSTAIVPPGLSSTNSTKPPSKAPAPAPPSKKPKPAAKKPAPEVPAPAPAAEDDVADSPDMSPAPVADQAADQEPAKSSGSSVALGTGSLIMCIVLSLSMVGF